MKRGALLAGIAATLILTACDQDDEKFSEKKVYDATKVENGKVQGDPFCAVDSVLSDADAIKAQRKKNPAGIITSKNGQVGVVVKPPFPDDCEQTVLNGLNDLDPVEDKQKE